jgi:hypothetical protein
MSALKIVAYDPNDYKLGEALAFENGLSIESPEKISWILSLYFQWPEHSKSVAFVTKDKFEKVQTKIEYDQEERELTQLFVIVKKRDLGEKKFFENLFLRMEIFDNCFEFESTLLEAVEEDDQWCFIVESPKKIAVIKNRRLPRVEIEANIRPNVPWIDVKTKQELNLSIKNISMNSFTTTTPMATGAVGVISFNGLEVHGQVMRSFEGHTIVQLEFLDDEQIGKYFDFYRLFAYPSLKSRHEVPYEDGIKLYQETGYFEKFEGSQEEEDKYEKLKETWKDLKEAEHKYTADYYVTDKDKPVGFGSASFSFKDDHFNYWTFHQLCALKDSDNLDQTKELYAWRAEYLTARKDNIKTLVWFTSTSRWIERVYVKFVLAKTKSKLDAVNLYSYNHIKQNEKSVMNNKSEIVTLSKKHNRLLFWNKEIIAGLLPDYYHANRNLNTLISLNKTISIKDVNEYLNSFTESITSEQNHFRITVQNDNVLEDNKFEKQTSDRLTCIHKDDLLDFINHLDHSIEITKKKYKKINGNN